MDRILKLLIIIFFVIAFFILLRVFFLGVYPDFSVYYSGSKAFLLGQNPYMRKPDYFSNYVYPPFVVLFFVPFALLSLPTASILFLVISVVSYFLGIYFCLKAITKLSFGSFAFIAALGMVSFPTKFTLGMGQVNLLIFFLLSLAFYFWKTKRKGISGALLGICFAIKFFPLLVLFYLIINKEWKILRTSLCVFLLFSLGVVFIIGTKTHEYYITHVLPGILHSYQAGYYNQAFSGFFARLPLDPQFGLLLKTVLSAIFVFVTFIGIYLSRKKKKTKDVALTLVITLSLLVNPFSWQHHFVWLILPFIVTFYAVKKSYKTIFLLCLAYILVSLNFPRPDRLPLLFESHVLFGTILLWFLQLRTILQKNNK